MENWLNLTDPSTPTHPNHNPRSQHHHQPLRPLPSYLALWSEKVVGALRMALEAYGGWVQCMSHEGGRVGVGEVERMLSALTVALPRAFCEATSKVGRSVDWEHGLDWPGLAGLLIIHAPPPFNPPSTNHHRRRSSRRWSCPASPPPSRPSATCATASSPSSTTSPSTPWPPSTSAASGALTPSYTYAVRKCGYAYVHMCVGRRPPQSALGFPLHLT